MMKLLLAAAVLVAASIQAYAKIGETTEELISRYGEPVKEENKEKEPGERILFFSFRDYKVEATVVSQTIDGKKFTGSTECIDFQRKDGAKIEQSEIDALMMEYGDKGEWVDQDLGRPAVMRSRDKKEFYLKKDQKNQSIICFIKTAQPYGIIFFSEKYYNAIIESGFKNMSIPIFGK